MFFSHSSRKNFRMDADKFLRHALIVVLLHVLLQTSAAFEEDFFVAAVYEHPRQGDYTSKPAEEVIQMNLEYYKKAAEVAKENGADLVLFPEYGIFPPENRQKLKEYLEIIPNPKETHTTPCDEAGVYSERPILYALSCIAKINNIVLVANMGGIEDCGTETNCSEDGVLHMNANVAFDQNGTLIGRYYKEHLYFELGMDLPRERQDPTFRTNFGKFATFICFDIIFKHMSEISQEEDIDAVVFSTMWVNSSPFYVSTEWWQAWAMGNNATLLASNIQMPGYFATGSGIFAGRDGAIASTFNPDGKPKLVIGTVPKRNRKITPESKVLVFTENGTEEWKNDGIDVPATTCSYDVLGPAKDAFKDYRCFNQDVANYTLVKLSKVQDHLKICNNGMCCELEYSASNISESFYFGVFNGTHIPYMRYPWAEESCFLARCNDINGTACSEFPQVSETVFHELSLTANFTSPQVFPVLLSSKIRLVPANDWSYDRNCSNASVQFSSSSGIQVISAGLLGRPFDRDPPYER